MERKYKVVDKNGTSYKTRLEIKEDIRKIFIDKGQPIEKDETLEKITNIYLYLVDDERELIELEQLP